MVVMDMLSTKFEMLSDCIINTPSFEPSLFGDISKALESLPGAGYVHGNIHDTNTMVFTNNQKGEISPEHEERTEPLVARWHRPWSSHHNLA